MCVPARFLLRLSLSVPSLTLSPALGSRLISSLPSFRKWSEAFVAVWLSFSAFDLFSPFLLTASSMSNSSTP
ncbi:hypothetical protein F4823DRAFT_572155 [Ustulina deusta]|nr:hypothetical protein F4823DRAFT_572155 [Ustulina deusta]